MKPTGLDAIERVIAAVQALLYFAEQGGANHGQVVEATLKFVGANPGDPWCAALQSYAGTRALWELEPKTLARHSYWPLTPTAGCQALFEEATKKGIVHTTPERGDLFVMWFPQHNRFAHTGLCVTPVGDGRWLTLDGNTIEEPDDPMHLRKQGNEGQSDREGWAGFPKRRLFKPADRFLRWSALL